VVHRLRVIPLLWSCLTTACILLCDVLLAIVRRNQSSMIRIALPVLALFLAQSAPALMVHAVHLHFNNPVDGEIISAEIQLKVTGEYGCDNYTQPAGEALPSSSAISSIIIVCLDCVAARIPRF